MHALPTYGSEDESLEDVSNDIKYEASASMNSLRNSIHSSHEASLENSDNISSPPTTPNNKKNYVCENFHITVWSLIRAAVDIFIMMSQPHVTLTLTQTIKKILNVGPETLTLILML